MPQMRERSAVSPHARRIFVVLALVAAAALAAGARAEPARATTSVKIVLPAHMQLNKKFSIKVTGVAAAGEKDALFLLQDSKPCARSSNAALGRPEILLYVSGALVKGTFTFTDPGIFLRSDPRFLGNVNFCAYLTQDLTTLSRTSVRAHLPR